MIKTAIYETVTIDKLVHGGQGIGVLEDGRKVFVWNALPGEKVRARLTKSKKDYAEAVAEEILESSVHRIEPKEEIFLATSPWQIMQLESENKYKADILKESYRREGIELSDVEMISDGRDFGYRNKIEFSFYGDDDGLHYAFYNRGTHQKVIVEGSPLALPAINQAAADLLVELNKSSTRASDLKSVIFRCTQEGKVVAALFQKTEVKRQIILPKSIAGLKIYYSNPKSPASVPTKLIHELGDCILSDKLLETVLNYDVTGFFQVNLPVFELALNRIDSFTADSTNKVDMYSGVGSIGLPIGGTNVLVELDDANTKFAETNAQGQDITIVQTNSEKALEFVSEDCCLIVDPPRAGLHKDLIERILEVKPKKIVYLSCNPSTQARDVALLNETYDLKVLEGYNFFPRTPHIESLAILELK